jgi:branched-chain amino acid transport system substrate-binding protein
MTDQPVRIGCGLSLTGPLASNGAAARIAHDIWAQDVNRKGGLLGRKVELVCLDDETNPKNVPGLYQRLLDDEKVDLVIGGYGDNSVAPAMPLVVERNRYFVALMALAVNASLNYPNYFVMIPTGPHPSEALTEGFFGAAAGQTPKPETLAIVAADAPFSKAPVQGAKAHADKHGFRVVSETLYPLSDSDLAPRLRPLKSIDPDILFFCSYLNDSVALLRALDELGLEPRLVGGAMIGPQNGAIKAQLGPLLNGVVNYEYWIPVPKLAFPGVEAMIAEYQSRVGSSGADPLGYYVAPQAYAQMQVVEQAILAVRSLDDAKLAQFTRDATFETVVGKVKFGPGGGWSEARVVEVQYQGIRSHDLADFKRPEAQAVVWPTDLASGSLIYPYAKARQPA